MKKTLPPAWVARCQSVPPAQKNVKNLLTNYPSGDTIKVSKGAEISYCLEGVWQTAISFNKTLELER